MASRKEQECHGDVLFAKGRSDEAARLAAIAAAYDPASRQLWAWVRAGGAWASGRAEHSCGVAGRAGRGGTETDRDTRLLRALPNREDLQVLEADLLDGKLDPGQFGPSSDWCTRSSC